MSASPPVHQQDAVVARLRTAGCVFAEDEAQLLIEAASTPAELESMIERRVQGLPLEQILGWAEFCGLKIIVEPGVFVPRRRTEFLARQAVAAAWPGAVIIDLCCGSGAVAAVLAAELGESDLSATDLDPGAVHCARRNLGSSAQVYEGDLYAPLPAALRGQVDVLVANAPYVPTASIALMPPEARVHEPQSALDGGQDGLDIARRVVAEAPAWLAPGGHLLIETSERQAPELARAFAANGLSPRIATSEELGATVIIGTQPSREFTS